MTDTLRTRIAAVLYERFATAMSFADAEWENVEQEWLEDADAVIRELGLIKVSMSEWDVLNHGWRGHRYVTEWMADE